jgi:hypothetical protein
MASVSKRAASATETKQDPVNCLFDVLRGKGLAPDKAQVLPSLWSTLFLVTPVVSTTFASVGRMLRPMPPESIGWLLIDEAGQAVPQAAAGALMRARRSAIVGDPLQIEPVVSLSPTLVPKPEWRTQLGWLAPQYRECCGYASQADFVCCRQSAALANARGV